jgi:peptidoglycan hydrolase CwlO-like protein
MKKLLLILALGTFAACNDGATTTDTTDSTANVIDSTADAKIDSVQNTADSLANKIDSTADAKIDTLKKK